MTDADASGLVELHPGDHLAVRLASVGEFWKEPDSDGVIIRKSTGGTCSDGSATAEFTALTPGSTAVFSETDLPCFHARPACLPPQTEISFFAVVLPALETLPAPTVTRAANADTVTVTVADVTSVIDLPRPTGLAGGDVLPPRRLAVHLPGGSGSWRYVQKEQYPPLYKVEQSTNPDGSASWIFNVNGDASTELVFLGARTVRDACVVVPHLSPDRISGGVEADVDVALTSAPGHHRVLATALLLGAGLAVIAIACGEADAPYPSPGFTPTPTVGVLPSPGSPSPVSETERTPQPTCCTPPPPTPLVTSRPTAVTTQSLMLDSTSNCKSFEVRVGTLISVRISFPTRGYQISPIDAWNSAVLMSTSGTVAGGTVTGTFVATGAGQTGLVAWADPTCLRSSPRCAASSLGWSVNILVSGR